MSVAHLLAVALGGSAGALARYGVSSALQRPGAAGFPLGTFAVNVAGCLAIGAILGYAETRPGLSTTTRLFLVNGLLGSFTTFSTFGHESLALLRTGETRTALLYVAGSLLVGLLAVVAGRAFVVR